MEKLTQQEMSLHSEFVRCGENAKEWLRKCAILLPEIEATKLWRKKGFTSIFHYAAVVAGMNHGQTREALRIMRRIQDKPALIAVAERKGLGAVRPVAIVATSETQDFWAGKASQMSQHTLEVYVRERLRAETSQPEKVTILMTLEPAVADQLEKMRGNGDWNTLMKKLLAGDKPAAAPAASRHVPKQIENFVRERTGEKCAYPFCFKPIHQLHHTQRWALEQVHDPARLQPLCRSHNEIAHLGLIENEEKSPINWKIREVPDRTSKKYKIDQKVASYMWRGG